MGHGWMLACIIISLQTTGLLCASAKMSNPDDSTDANDDLTCNAKLVDTCFADVYANLECHLNPRARNDCKRKDVADLCSAVDDGLNCADTILNSDCTKQDNIVNADAWLEGFRAVYGALCDGQQDFMKVLVQNSQCWNSLVFVKCVEDKLKIRHVVDLLQTKLDMGSCLGGLIAMAGCNVRASNQAVACAPLEGVFTELIQTFFVRFDWCQLRSTVNNSVSCKLCNTCTIWILVACVTFLFI